MAIVVFLIEVAEEKCLKEKEMKEVTKQQEENTYALFHRHR